MAARCRIHLIILRLPGNMAGNLQAQLSLFNWRNGKFIWSFVSECAFAGTIGKYPPNAFAYAAELRSAFIDLSRNASYRIVRDNSSLYIHMFVGNRAVYTMVSYTVRDRRPTSGLRLEFYIAANNSLSRTWQFCFLARIARMARIARKRIDRWQTEGTEKLQSFSFHILIWFSSRFVSRFITNFSQWHLHLKYIFTFENCERDGLRHIATLTLHNQNLLY